MEQTKEFTFWQFLVMIFLTALLPSMIYSGVSAAFSEYNIIRDMWNWNPVPATIVYSKTINRSHFDHGYFCGFAKGCNGGNTINSVILYRYSVGGVSYDGINDINPKSEPSQAVRYSKDNPSLSTMYSKSDLLIRGFLNTIILIVVTIVIMAGVRYYFNHRWILSTLRNHGF